MSVIMDRTLLARLAVLERTIPKNHYNPLLTYLAMELHPDGLAFIGSGGDVDLEVRFTLPTGEKPRRLLVPAQPFFQLVRNLPEDQVRLDFGEELSLSSGSFNTRLSLASDEGYPDLYFPSPDPEPSDIYPLQTQLPPEELVEALTHARYAASNEEYRAIFQGVQLEFSEGGLRSIASDGYRLALYDLPTSQPFTRKAVIPATSVDEIVKVLKGTSTDRVLIALGQGVLGLAAKHEGGAVRMAVRLMKGEFPDYDRVIPKNFPSRVVFHAGSFLKALQRVSVLSDRLNHRVDLVIEADRIILSAEGDYGKGEEEISAELYGEPLALMYNSRHLRDALAFIPEEAQLLLSGVNTPTLVMRNPEDRYQAVVVPLRGS